MQHITNHPSIWDAVIRAVDGLWTIDYWLRLFANTASPYELIRIYYVYVHLHTTFKDDKAIEMLVSHIIDYPSLSLEEVFEALDRIEDSLISPPIDEPDRLEEPVVVDDPSTHTYSYQTGWSCTWETCKVHHYGPPS